MSELSTQLTNRKKWAKIVENAGKVHGPIMAKKLGELLDGRAGLDGQQVLTFYLAIIDLLVENTKLMEVAEHKTANERTEDSEAREERDEATSDGRNALMKLRRAAVNTLGERGPRTYGLPSLTPSRPAQVLTVLNDVIQRFEQNPIDITGDFGSSFNSDQILAQLRPIRDRLADCKDLVSQEVRETEQSMLDRNKIVEDWERIYRGVAGLLSYGFAITDRDDLAGRVRPTARRATGTVEPDVDVEEDVEPVM